MFLSSFASGLPVDRDCSSHSSPDIRAWLPTQVRSMCIERTLRSSWHHADFASQLAGDRSNSFKCSSSWRSISLSVPKSPR
jgi:hypothetical protein